MVVCCIKMISSIFLFKEGLQSCFLMSWWLLSPLLDRVWNKFCILKKSTTTTTAENKNNNWPYKSKNIRSISCSLTSTKELWFAPPLWRQYFLNWSYISTLYNVIKYTERRVSYRNRTHSSWDSSSYNHYFIITWIRASRIPSNPVIPISLLATCGYFILWTLYPAILVCTPLLLMRWYTVWYINPMVSNVEQLHFDSGQCCGNCNW